jgi:hypothetical protein
MSVGKVCIRVWGMYEFYAFYLFPAEQELLAGKPGESFFDKRLNPLCRIL